MANITHTISIRANTSQAKASLQDLQAQLSSLQSIPISADVSGLQTARSEINQLGQSLRTAMNPNTGKLDLSIFSQQLEKSGKTLNDYKNALFSMGTQGQQAFLSLANTIAAAEAPTNRLNAKLIKFGQTIKNTINWQLSSMMIHSVMGQIQGAINYAEKLNQSLNNIQIITGQNNEKMAEFARQANQTAKQLSTTTTEYTNASLIYYQQGLNDKQVAERTQTTLKLANVTRQSAQEVSNQMTAIWNNFDDGTQSLEHYADVITALGAATASSSAEIAGGLEKFAAIAKTVGLSYDYATTALATIVATTRQSEDTVGTGLRTLFARLEGLKLGQTLEDGVGLNKYSSALAAVGVNIQDQYGKIKDMDTILEELGAKWGTISKEQQIALAQTVGGVRQYANLIALMDNWQYFQRNLQIAQGADGTLQTQAERYAEGWEAARKRVRTATEGIYDALIDDQAIIKVTNVFAGFLDVINGLVAGFGGLKGIIPIVGALLMNSFAKNMPQFVSDIKTNWQTLTGKGIRNMGGIQTSLDNTLNTLIKNSPDEIYKMQLQKIKDQNFMNQSLLQNARRMSDADQAAYRLQMANRGYLWDASISAAQEAQQAKQAQDDFITQKVKIKQKSVSDKSLQEAINREYEKLSETQSTNAEFQKRFKAALTPEEAEAYNTARTQMATYGAGRKDLLSQQQVAEQAVRDAIRNSSAFRSNRKDIEEAETTLKGLEAQRDQIEGKLGSKLSKAERSQLETQRADLDTEIRRVNTNISRAKALEQKYLNEKEPIAEEKVQAALKARAEATKKVTETETKYNTAVNNATEIENKRSEISDEILHTMAKETGTAEAMSEVEKQKSFLQQTYEKAGITTSDSARALLESEKLGWEFDKNGNVKTVGKALTAENLGRQLTTAEQGWVDKATQATIADVVTAAQKVQKFSTASDIIKGNEAILNEEDIKPDFLKKNIIDQMKGLRSFGSDFLETLFGDKNGIANFSKLTDEEMEKLGENGIWGKICESLGITDPENIEEASKMLKKAYGEATQKATSEVQKGETELENAEKKAIGSGGVTNVQGVTERAKAAADAEMRSKYTGTQTGGTAPTATPTQSAISTAMAAASALTMMVSTMNNTANNLNTIMNESASGAEKFGAVLSEAASLLMTFALVTKLANDTIIQSAIQKKAKQGTGLLSGIAGKITGMSPTTIGLILTAAMTVFGITKGIIQKVEQDNKEKRQAKMEAADTAISDLSASRDLRNSQINLINSYNAAAKAVEEGTATTKDLADAQKALVEKLMEQTESGLSNKNAVAAAYAGNMELVSSILDQNIVNNNKNRIKTAQEGLKASGEQLEKDIKRKTIDIYDQGIGNIISDVIKSRGLEQGVRYRGSTTEGGYNGQLILQNRANAESIVAYYDALAEISTKLQEAGLTDTTEYSQISQQISQLSDGVKKYKEYSDNIALLQAETLAAGGVINGITVSKGRAEQAITDIQSYNEYRQALMESIAQTQGISKEAFANLDRTEETYTKIADLADTVLGVSSSVTGNELGNLQYISTGIENVIEYQKKNNAELFTKYDELNGEGAGEKALRESLATTYKEYGDALFEVGTKYKIPLKFDEQSGLEGFEHIFDLIKARAKELKIETQLDIVANFDLTSSSTTEAWSSFAKNLNKDLWEEIIKKEFDLSSFAALSEEERSRLLTQYSQGLKQSEYGVGGTKEQELANLYTQQKLDRAQAFAADRTEELKSISLLQQLGITEGKSGYLSTIESASGIINDLYNKLYNEEGQRKILSLFTKSDKDSLAQAGLGAIDTPEKIAATKEYLDAIDAVTKAYQDMAETEVSIKDIEADLQAYKDIGFRDILVAEAALWGINYDEVQRLAKAERERNNGLKDLITSQEDLIRESEEYALAVLKQKAAITQLGKAYSDYEKPLKKWKNDILEASDPDVRMGIIEIQDSLVGIFGGSRDDYSEDFIRENFDTIKKLGEGDLQAFQELGQSRAEAILKGMKDKTPDEIKSMTEGIEDLIAKDPVKVGTVLSFDQAQANDYLGTIQGYFDSHQINVDQLIDLAGAGGYAPIIETTTVSTEAADSIKQSGEVEVLNPDGTSGGTRPVHGEVRINGDGTTSVDYISGWQKVSPGSTSPKGGGGGGKKKKDSKKPDTGTRYHTIRAQQANNNQNMQEKSRLKDRAFGAEKIKQAKEEIELQKEQIELQRRYVDEITDYLAGDRKRMEDSFQGIGVGLEIDKDGVITNYRAVEEELLRQENELIDKFNEGKLDDEKYQEAQKKIDEAREYLKIYEETRDLYENELIKLVEEMDELADKALDLTKMEIELKIDISDDKLKYLEYLLDKLNDDAYQVAEAIALIGDQTAENLNRVGIYQEGLEKILASKGFSLEDLNNLTDEDLAAANFTEKEIDQIREWRNALLDANKELLKTREEIIDRVIDGFDELNEKIEKSYDNFNKYNDVLEDYKNIAELLGMRLNQQHQQLLQDLGRASLANAQQQTAAARKIYDDAIKNYNDAQQAYDNLVAQGATDEKLREYERIVEATQGKMDDAQQQWLEAWQATLEKAQELYTTAIDNVVKKFEESVSGLFGSLDYLQSAFDRSNQVGDQYLQDFEKLYELNKLNRDIQKEIDDTSSIRNKQALRDMQKELNALQEKGVKLSQYDVDAARKRFELEMARQAVEDARNNRSEVRLHRDANGNWGYVYTAMEDEVDAAEQEYANKLYEYQKLNDDYINELQSRVLETQQTYKEALAEIWSDTTLTDEQREARIAELNAWKDAELAYFEDQLKNAMENQQGTLEMYYKIYNTNQAELADSWDETTLRMITGAESVVDYMTNVRGAIEDMLRGARDAFEQYQSDVDETDDMAGVSTEEFAEETATAIEDIGKKSLQTREEITKLSEELVGEFKSSLEAAIDWEEQYSKAIDDAIAKNENFIQSLNALIAKLAELESSNPELKAARAAYQKAEAEHEARVKAGTATEEHDPEWEAAKKVWEDYLDSYLGKFSSGGYTGDWGPEGRLAILHEHENVFNAEDTDRLLNAAQILRTIDLSAKSFAIGLGNMLLPQIGGFAQTLDQNVHIDATFPNVTDHNEIELAFDNLINKASQYANRKNMSAMTFQDMYISKF